MARLSGWFVVRCLYRRNSISIWTWAKSSIVWSRCAASRLDLSSGFQLHHQTSSGCRNRRLQELIHSLAGTLTTALPRIKVLTNVVNNALMEAHTSLNTGSAPTYEPLLYLPTGVIYLKDRTLHLYQLRIYHSESLTKSRCFVLSDC